MKLKDLLTINNVLKSFIDNKEAASIDVAFKFKILNILKTIEEQNDLFEQLKNEKIMEYGTTDENGNISVSQGSEEFEKLVNELDKLLDTEVDVTIPKINAEDAFKYFQSQYLLALYEIIEQ